MIKTINKYDFAREFQSWDTYKDKFTIEALDAIFDYCESIDEQFELDVVAIACDWTEYDSLADVTADYPDVKTMEDLENSTTVLPVGETGRLLVMNF